MRYSEAHITSVSCLSCLLILIQTSCSVVVVVVGFVVGLVLLVLALVHGAVRNLSSTRSLFRARYCCVRAACVRARTLSTVRARSQPHNQLQLPPLPRPQLTADLTPVITSPLTCDNVLPCPPDHPPHPPRHNGVPGLRGLQLQGSDGVHSVLFSRPRPGQACGKDGPRTQGPRY